MIGQTISHYRIVEKLGEGGMGIVYVGEDTVLGRRVAIKTLTAARSSTDQHFRGRFLREARSISKLSHPHIATIYDYGETADGQPYIVMELIEGETLSHLMAREALTIPRVIEIVEQVAEALAEAHRHGIIHRDIKPSNIAINERGDVKVLDFGLAKEVGLETADSVARGLLNTQTREGVIVGTPMYLSPEQALGVEVDERSDLFSLGSVLYECIAGQPAFAGPSPVEICAKVIRDDPPTPSRLNGNIPRELDRITLKALAKKPEARYQTGADMIADLQTAYANLQKKGSDQTVTRLLSSVSNNQPSSALATLSDLFKRPRLSIGYVAGGLILLAAIIFLVSRWTRVTLPPPSPEAQQLYDKGVAALQEGSYFKASKLLERAVAADDKFALAHARLAEAYTELDYTDRAKDQMLSASRIVTNRSMLDQTSALYYDAISATLARDVLGSISSYSEIVKLKSNEAAAYLDLGRAYENHDEIDKAIEQYSKAATLDANNPAPPLRLAVLYGRHQDLSKSNEAFDKAESLYKDSQNFEGNAEVAYQRGSLFSQTGKITEAQNAAQQSLDVAKVADNKYQQVRALLLIGAIGYQSGDTTKGQQLVTQAIELSRSNDMENLTTQSLLDLGYALMIKGSYDETERYLKQALDLAQRYKEKRNEARANLLLGTLYIQKEHADKGAPFIDQALAFYRGGGYRREVSRCMMMVGREQLLKGDFDGALKTLDEQLQLAKQVEDPGQLARSQAEIAAALSKQDLYPQALVRYTESYELNKQLNNPLNAAFAVYNRGDMLARLGQYEEAIKAMAELNTYLAGLSNDNSYKSIWGAWSHLILARMYLSQRHPSDARSECARALAEVAKDDRETQAEIKGTQGLIEVFDGARAAGRKLCEEALAEASSGFSVEHLGSLHFALAEAEIESGDVKSALTEAGSAQKFASESHQSERVWRAWLIAARASDTLGDLQTKRDALSRARFWLGELKKLWGAEAFNSYAARPDIQSYQKQLDQLS
ncbi:MAG: eukaryotic-like serine/threonine-protein kinase [Blastocatellia bacterium]|nr:eukaryotic-like serine/threonine-protein kinase [Blastocatellia bacterium]